MEDNNNIEYLKKKWDNVSFDDFKGLNYEIEFLKDSTKKLITSIENDYKKRKYKIKYGVILYGAPGTGKTPLIQSLILHYMEMYPDMICNKWLKMEEILKGNDVGENINAVHKFLSNIKNEADKYKVYYLVIDDMEHLLKNRRAATGANQESIIRKIMHELDELPENVQVLVTCNLPIIDEAIIKRIGKVLKISFLNAKARRDVFELYTRDINMTNVDIDWLVLSTENFTGYEIKEVCVNVLHKLDEKKIDKTQQFNEYISDLFYEFIDSYADLIEKRKIDWEDCLDGSKPKLKGNKGKIYDLLLQNNNRLTQKNISEILGMRFQHVSRDLIYMEKKKLITFSIDDKDKRTKIYNVKNLEEQI